eukprot:scaffold1428_cov259-Pinguiococcus_pyrenoidosus.AAC.4
MDRSSALSKASASILLLKPSSAFCPGPELVQLAAPIPAAPRLDSKASGAAEVEARDLPLVWQLHAQGVRGGALGMRRCIRVEPSALLFLRFQLLSLNHNPQG